MAEFVGVEWAVRWESRLGTSEQWDLITSRIYTDEAEAREHFEAMRNEDPDDVRNVRIMQREVPAWLVMEMD